MQTNLQIKSQLAKNPEHPPQFAREVDLPSGEPIHVADPSATRAMVALMDMQAVLGGAASHWGGPSAFAELMSAAHGIMFQEGRLKKQPWFELFNFVNDAGHCENGLYALKANYRMAGLSIESLKGFRSIQSPLTGHGEAHLFPEGVLISNGPLGSALPQSEGLAFGDHLLANQRVTITAISDGACMEGEAREALASIPGLAANGKLNPYVLIISDNNTKLSGRIDRDAFSMEPTFKALAPLGWNVLHLENGHDLEACVRTIATAIDMARATPTRPVAVHARTIKGFGVKKTADSTTGGHGFPLKAPNELPAFLSEIYGGDSVPEEFLSWSRQLEKEHAAAKPAAGAGEVKVQAGIAKALIRMKEKGLPVFTVSADLQGSTGVAEFQKKFPDATQDVGVAEANMISVAAGLSKTGFIPIVDTFSQFGVTKGALPLWMANLSDAPVIAVFSHAGFQDAADGASHQALAYFAMTSAIPHTRVFALSSADEADALLSQAIEEFAADRRAGRTPPSYVFFLGRENFPPSYGKDLKYQLGRSQVLFDNAKEYSKSVTLVAAGALVGQALMAAEKLTAQKTGCIVVNASSINHPDVETIGACLKKTFGQLLTVEDHQMVGGMGGMLLQALANHEVPFQANTLGVADAFGQSAYSALDLYRKHGLDADSIASKVLKFID